MGNEKLKKTIVTISTVTVVGLGSMFFSTPAAADSLNDLKSKETEIQQDRENLKGNLSAAESEIADLLIDLEKVNKDIKRVTKALEENKATLKKNEKDISNTQSEVDKLEEEIVQLEDSIEKRFAILKERAAAYQKSGGNISYIEVLFGSKSFGDFISRVSAINKITDSDAALMEQIEEDKVIVEEKQDDVLAKLDELNEMNVELEGIQEVVKDQQKENKAKKATLKEKEATLVAKVDELEIKDSKLASLEKEVKLNIEELTQPVEVAQVASESVDNSSNSDGNVTTLSDKKDNSSVSAPAPSGGVNTAMNAGSDYVGKLPYVWGGKSPQRGFDCSGFVSWAFAQGGISLPSSTSAMQSVGTKVSSSNMQPGDIVFFDTYKTNGHVGIYLGGGQFIGSQSSTGLAYADMSSGYWAEAFKGHARRVR